MTGHRIRTSVTVDGSPRPAPVGWRTVRRTRQQRDQDTDAHELNNVKP